jgi:hypothetical protein
MPRNRVSRTLLATLFILATAAPLLTPTDAAASQGDASVWLGAGLSNAPAVNDDPLLGTAGELGLNIDINDFWSLDFGFQSTVHFGRDFDNSSVDGFYAQHLFAGFRYNLDIFTFVPYLGMSAVAFIPGPPPDPASAVQPAVGGKLNIGVDWRFARHWSTGLRAELHLLSSSLDRFPSYNMVGWRVTYHFRL